MTNPPWQKNAYKKLLFHLKSNRKMFNSGIKGNQRSNGLVPPSSVDRHIKSKQIGLVNCNNKVAKTITNNKVYDNYVVGNHTDPGLPVKGLSNNSPLHYHHNAHNMPVVKVKVELEDDDFENKITAHSIIGKSEEIVKMHKSPSGVRPKPTWGSLRATHHETLQRIDDEYNHYQRHWFSASLEKFKVEDRSRQERMEITRHEFLRHLQQMVRSNVGKRINKKKSLEETAKTRDESNANFADGEIQSPVKSPHQGAYDRLVAPTVCDVEGCRRLSLPCARHCTLHIMLNSDQVLFGYCTAKFADNTQCSVPVFDIIHELPLCAEHARKRDNYQLYQEAKPKKLRKKVKPSAMIRPQKRSKKRRKPVPSSTVKILGSAISDVPIPVDTVDIVEEAPELEDHMHIVNQVLGLNESDALEQVLETQASHLLEETDISTVLSTIQVDEFSDFFAVNRNGEYEPSREETEELEKALAAVDNDVKSLEKLSQSQGLLDSLLDEHTLAETLVQVPDVFHNGYPSSFLLPVEQQSHS